MDFESASVHRSLSGIEVALAGRSLPDDVCVAVTKSGSSVPLMVVAPDTVGAAVVDVVTLSTEACEEADVVSAEAVEVSLELGVAVVEDKEPVSRDISTNGVMRMELYLETYL